MAQEIKELLKSTFYNLFYSAIIVGVAFFTLTYFSNL
jgi:hypothetical protein